MLPISRVNGSVSTEYIHPKHVVVTGLVVLTPSVSVTETASQSAVQKPVIGYALPFSGVISTKV